MAFGVRMPTLAFHLAAAARPAVDDGLGRAPPKGLLFLAWPWPDGAVAAVVVVAALPVEAEASMRLSCAAINVTALVGR